MDLAYTMVACNSNCCNGNHTYIRGGDTKDTRLMVVPNIEWGLQQVISITQEGRDYLDNLEARGVKTSSMGYLLWGVREIGEISEEPLITAIMEKTGVSRKDIYSVIKRAFDSGFLKYEYKKFIDIEGSSYIGD